MAEHEANAVADEQHIQDNMASRKLSFNKDDDDAVSRDGDTPRNRSAITPGDTGYPSQHNNPFLHLTGMAPNPDAESPSKLVKSRGPTNIKQPTTKAQPFM